MRPSIGVNYNKESDQNQMRHALLLLVITSALLTSCGPAEAPDTRAQDAAAIQATDEQWSATAAKNDVDGTVSYYAADAVLLPPNAPIAKDPKSIRDMWAGLLAPGNSVSWKPVKVEVAKSGDLGYVQGTYQLSMKDAKGATMNDTGKFIEVWRKQPDGKWKCIVDTFNSDLPAAPPPPADTKKK